MDPNTVSPNSSSRTRRGPKLSGLFAGVVALGLTLVFFQNCGSHDGSFQDVGAITAAAQQASFFNYPYTSEPTYYWNISAFSMNNSQTPAGINQLQFIAVARNIKDLTASTAYQIQIQTPQGATLCPSQSGTLTPPTTTVTINCTTAVTSLHFNVNMVLGAGSSAQTIQQSF